MIYLASKTIDWIARYPQSAFIIDCILTTLLVVLCGLILMGIGATIESSRHGKK